MTSLGLSLQNHNIFVHHFCYGSSNHCLKKPPFLNGKKAPFPSLQVYLYKMHSLSSTIVQKYEMISSNDWLWRVTVCTTVVLFFALKIVQLPSLSTRNKSGVIVHFKIIFISPKSKWSGEILTRLRDCNLLYKNTGFSFYLHVTDLSLTQQADIYKLQKTTLNKPPPKKDNGAHHW